MSETNFSPFQSLYGQGNLGMNDYRLNIDSPYSQQMMENPNYYSPISSVDNTTPSNVQNGLAGLFAGASAAGQYGQQNNDPTADLTEAGVGALMSGVSGAAAGAPGGPVGMVVGGGIGLLIGGANAYFSVKKARRQNREKKRLIRKAEEAEKKRIEREDAFLRTRRLDQIAVDEQTRKDSIITNQWNAYLGKLAALNNMVGSSQLLQEQFMKSLNPVNISGRV